MTNKRQRIDQILLEIQTAVDDNLTAAGLDMFANEGEYAQAYGELRTFKSELEASFELMPDALTSEMNEAIEARTISLLTESQLFAHEDDSEFGGE